MASDPMISQLDLGTWRQNDVLGVKKLKGYPLSTKIAVGQMVWGCGARRANQSGTGLTIMRASTGNGSELKGQSRSSMLSAGLALNGGTALLSRIMTRLRFFKKVNAAFVCAIQAIDCLLTTTTTAAWSVVCCVQNATARWGGWNGTGNVSIPTLLRKATV